MEWVGHRLSLESSSNIAQWSRWQSKEAWPLILKYGKHIHYCQHLQPTLSLVAQVERLAKVPLASGQVLEVAGSFCLCHPATNNGLTELVVDNLFKLSQSQSLTNLSVACRKYNWIFNGLTSLKCKLCHSLSDLACLMDVLDRNPQGLQAECRETLRKRREMYNTAIKVGNRRLTIREHREGESMQFPTLC